VSLGSSDQGDFSAPRFRAYLEHKANRRIFVWPVDEWEAVKPNFGSPVLLDIEITPFASLPENAIYVAAAAQEVSSTGAGVAIYRYDQKDPKLYNVDYYGVWENLPSHPDFSDIVNAASTNADANLLDSLRRNVFLVKLDRGPGHWLSFDELPAEIKVVIEEQEE